MLTPYKRALMLGPTPKL